MALHTYLKCLIFFCILDLITSNNTSDGDELAKANVSRRIYYGDDVNILEYPFYSGFGKHCGAAIISEIWLLTAAHCAELRPQEEKFVYVGGDRVDNSLSIPYERYFIHERYNRNLFLHDIALVKLSEPLKFSPEIQPVALETDSRPRPFSMLTVVGRGQFENGSSSIVLKKSELLLLPTDECLRVMETYRYAPNFAPLFQRTHICAAQKDGKPSACEGDSGGPLVNEQRRLVGLVSFGPQNCRQGPLAFYVFVPNYLSWIHRITGIRF